MNKQEAIKQVELMGEYERFVDEPISKKSVLNILSQIDEPQKVEIPQLVADWIEENRCNFKRALLELVKECYELVFDEYTDIHLWFLDKEIDSFTILVNAYQFSYEVEQEIKYRVRIKDGLVIGDTLTENPITHLLTFSIGDDSDNEIFTKKELEAWGFGDVFNNSMFEVEEVE